METFTPIAMKCTRKQFEAIKPKLNNFCLEGVKYGMGRYYLTNWFGNVKKINFTWVENKGDHNRKVYEEWNEEIFLKSCGIEIEQSDTFKETLEKRLQKAEAEVKRLQEAIENIKIKDGDWVYCSFGEYIFKYTHGRTLSDLKKITDPELISKLNELINH